MRVLRPIVVLSLAVVTGAMLTAVPAHADDPVAAPTLAPMGAWATSDDSATTELADAEWPHVRWQPDATALQASVTAESPADTLPTPGPSAGEGATVKTDASTADRRAKRAQAAAVERNPSPVGQMSTAVGSTAGAPGVGEQSWYSFQDFPLTPSDVARVNIANGNLLVKATDLRVAAPGYGLSVERFYNSFSSRGSVGGGWNVNNSLDVGLSVQSGFIDYYAPNGAVLRFTQQGSRFEAPAGANLTMEKPGDYTITDNKSGDRMTFNTSGFLTSAKDRNGSGLDLSPHRLFPSALAMSHTNGRSITPLPNGSTPGHAGYSDGSRQVTYARDSAGRLTTVTPPSGSAEATTYGYDSASRLTSITVPGADAASGSLRTVTFTYDSAHRIATVREESGAQTSFAYGNGQTTVTDENGHASVFSIDANGRVVSAKDALNRTRAQTWTPNSDIATTTDAVGSNITTYTYDGSGNRTTAQLPTGAAASAVYAVGSDCSAPQTGTAFQAKCSTDDAGNQKQYEYDSAGNLEKQTTISTAGTSTTDFERVYETYGPTCGAQPGQVCSAKDGNGNTTTYQYSGAGDLLRVVPPSPLLPTTYTYDSLGRVISVKDGNDATTTYLYDVRDRVLRTTFTNGQYVEQTYYPNGLARTQTDSAGGSKTLQYDGEGRITNETGPQNGVSQTYTYDMAGNMTSFTDGSGTTRYAYDASNQLTSVQQPGGQCPATSTLAPQSGCVKFEYDQNALESKRLLPGGASTVTTRDNAGRPTRITATTGSGAVAVDIGYGYATVSAADRVNVQTRTSFAEQGIAAGAVTTYSYDARNRLTLADEKVGPTSTASWSYAYDNAGNRTAQTRSGSTGSSAGTIDYTYNAASQLVSATGSAASWTYDGAGNQTKRGPNGTSATYGDRGESLSIGSAPNDYFGVGNTDRLGRGGATFISGALGLMQRDAAYGPQTFTRTPEGGAVGYKQDKSYYYVHDHLGSVVGVLTAAGTYSGGYSYSPYGEARASATTLAVVLNVVRYIGGHQDSANLYKLGARYYDAAQGRFTQMDPSGQEKNPYAYAACNTVNISDSTGLNCAGAISGVVMGVLGLGASIAAEVIALAGEIPSGGTSTALGILGVIGIVTGYYGVVDGIGNIADEC